MSLEQRGLLSDNLKKKKKIKKPCSGKPLSNFRKHKVRRVPTLEKGLEENKSQWDSGRQIFKDISRIAVSEYKLKYLSQFTV